MVTENEGIENAEVELPIGGETEAPIETPEAPIDEGAEEIVASEGDAQWEPNFKVKVRDDEREIDEWAKEYIKDPETEKKFRDLYERAYGTEFLKEDRSVLRDHNKQLSSTIQEKYEPYVENYKRLGAYVENKNYGEFLKQWNIPPEDMVDFAIQHVKMNDPNTPPEERQAYQAQMQQTQQLADLQYQNNMLTQQLQGSTVQQTAVDLNMELSKPDISQIAQEYDSRVGQPGSFRDRVINMGSMMSQPDPRTGQSRVASVQEALNQTIQFLGYNPNAMGQGTPQQGAQPGQAMSRQQMPGQVPAQQAAKPVIPTVRGSGASPVRQSPRSIAKLRELAQAAGAEG